jgi:hypothetical protein
MDYFEHFSVWYHFVQFMRNGTNAGLSNAEAIEASADKFQELRRCQLDRKPRGRENLLQSKTH